MDDKEIQTMLETRLTAAYPDHTMLNIRVIAAHATVRLCTAAFEGLSILNRHRSVSKLFAKDISAGDIHALELHLTTPTKTQP